jgi:hypothetical protein
MSRSNPSANAPNPAVRWFEWNGEQGTIRYYDKDAKQNVDVPLPFTFLLLDEVARVGGWHDASESGIYSNEVKDTRTDLLVVKAFKGGTLAEGLYKDIKDRINTLGGQFVTNCYIGFKNGDGRLAIGSLRFKGAALGAWMEFRKANRSALYDKAVSVVAFEEGKKGRIVFRVPTFEIKAIGEDSNRQAVDLDKELQAWMKGYFSRKTNDQSEAQRDTHDDYSESGEDVHSQPLTDDDIPF